MMGSLFVSFFYATSHDPLCAGFHVFDRETEPWIESELSTLEDITVLQKEIELALQRGRQDASKVVIINWKRMEDGHG